MSEETQLPDPVPGHAESPAPVEDAGTTQDVGEAAPGRSGEGSNPGAGTHTGAQTVAGGIATWPPPQPQPPPRRDVRGAGVAGGRSAGHVLGRGRVEHRFGRGLEPGKVHPGMLAQFRS